MPLSRRIHLKLWALLSLQRTLAAVASLSRSIHFATRTESALYLVLHEDRHDAGHFGNTKEHGVLKLSFSISEDVLCPESIVTGTDIWTPTERS